MVGLGCGWSRLWPMTIQWLAEKVGGLQLLAEEIGCLKWRIEGYALMLLVRWCKRKWYW